MTNVLDYLAWRGDLSFGAFPFCDVDALVLSRLVYVPLDGVAGPAQENASCTVAEAAAACLAGAAREKDPLRFRLEDDEKLLRELTDSPRFGALPLYGFVNHFDKKEEKQFCAVTVGLGKNETFIAFRGTDGTVVGWKEDFNMSFDDAVPAQEEALRYLEQAAAAHRGVLRVGGHSKGGNLAVYAAALCSARVQKRIVSVCNFDGPGFNESVLAQKGFADILGRVHTYLPQSSVIGMLLEHDETFSVVHSNNSGLMQHDVYSWDVLRTQFLPVEGITHSGQFIDTSLKNWIAAMDREQRKKFVDGLFSVVESLDATTLRDLWKGANPLHILRNIARMDDETSRLINEAFGILLRSMTAALPGFLEEAAPEQLRPLVRQAFAKEADRKKEPQTV